MGSKKVFMKIDLQWGFNNVRIKKGDVRQQEKKKKHLGGKSYQDNLQQRSYSDGQINSMIRSIREDWKEIGDNGKEKELKGKEQQK